jgi:hypothetical protein
VLRTDFLFFLPRFLKSLRPVERFIAAVSLSAQYQVLSQRSIAQLSGSACKCDLQRGRVGGGVLDFWEWGLSLRMASTALEVGPRRVLRSPLITHRDQIFILQ